MSVITETEIYSMSKEQNYMRGYRDGQSDVLDKYKAETEAIQMRLRTKGEQKAYLDGYEMCAECIEKYLTEEGKRKLECMLIAVKNAVEIEDFESQESEEI